MQIIFGDFLLKPRERELIGPAGPLELSGRSFDLLQALLDKPGELVGKSELFDAVWPGTVVEENTLQVHMSALRKALGPGFITTVHGRGYKYVGPAPREADQPGQGRPVSGGNIDCYRADCIARDAEIATVQGLLAQNRLVSVLGPGGVGKTTLAVAVASGLGKVDGGVWMVDLASLGSGEFVESALIQTLGVPFRAGSRVLDSIVEYLQPTEAVLLFDNCEHVRADVARVVRELLEAVPGLRILATSQVPLGLPREQVFKLLPFAVGAEDTEGSASAQFLAYCYETFGEQLSEAELPIVARLCRRLDGVALAIKMAAARAATVGIETVDRQLEQQLAGLAADWDPAHPRHRSLVASLSWSYELLEAGDQQTLRALGVFHGSFPIDAVVAVAGPEGDRHVAELVRRSLVVRDAYDRTRYRLLDSTRRFALDKLAEAGEERLTRDRHAAWVAAYFVDGVRRWEEMPDAEWERRYRPDGDNLRAALAWARAEDNAALYVELAGGSYRFFLQEQLGAEGLDVIEAGMPLLGAAPPGSAARLNYALGEICRFNAMDIRARAGVEPAVAYYRTTDDVIGYAQALVLLTWITIFFRPLEEAPPLVAELDALLPRVPVSKVKSWGLVAIGIQTWAEGNAAAGLARAEAGLAMHLDTGNPKGRYRSAINLCEMLHKGDDTERALRIAEEVIPEMRRDGAPLQLGVMLTNMACYNYAMGRTEPPKALLREAALHMPRTDSSWHWCLVQGMAELHAHEGRPEVAALLLGYTDQRFESWADGRQETEILQRDRILLLLDAVLPPAERDRLIEQGRALTHYEADHQAGLYPGERRLLG